MYQLSKITVFSCCLICFASAVSAQFTISGTVYDSSKVIPVKGVDVITSNGTTAITDSLGHYNIVSTDKDSIKFIYQGKPTATFAVKQITNIGSFDISLHIRINQKYKQLKEVKVYSRNFKQDSVENRERYAGIFNYHKPGVKTTTSAYSGSAGMDLDELINVFRFKRNRRLKYMQNRLLEEEQENYINYRFNKSLVRRITKIEGKDLDNFMLLYRPDFEFTQTSNTVDFYQYIITASYQFKSALLQGKP